MKISVCIATFNGENFIEEQIRSILVQLNANDEIIVSDGGSSDKTLEIINSLNDLRIKVFHWTEIKRNNTSFAKMDRIRRNFENALIRAKGDIIFMSDQDDIWNRNKVSEVCKELNQCSLVLHDCKVIDAQGNQIKDSVFASDQIYKNLFGMFIKSPFMGCCMAFNKTVLERALPFPDLHIEYDTWIGICAYKVGHVSFLNQPLIQYRRHGANASTSSNKSVNPFWIKLMRRIYMLDSYVRY